MNRFFTSFRMTKRDFLRVMENNGMGRAHAIIFPQQPGEICHSEPLINGEESTKASKS